MLLDARIEIGEKEMIVYPPSYPAEELREILGGRQNKEDKAKRRFRLAPTAWNVLALGDMYGEEFIAKAPEPIQDLFRLDWGFPGFEEHPDLEAKALDHPNWEKLYDFQKKAVEYIVCNPHRGTLLSLSPGLGKTVVTVISWDVLEANKVLVLAPLTLARNWGKEINKWSRYFRSWTRATAAEKDPRTEATITNFETVFYTILRREDGKVFEPEDQLTTLEDGEEVPHYRGKDGSIIALGLAKNPRAAKAWIEAGPKSPDPQTGKKKWDRVRITQARPTYANQDWDLIVVDESILLKNRKAIKVEVIQQLAKYSHYVLLLSGSPTAKYRDDLFPQLKTIMPRGFSAYWRFADFFCIVERGQWGWSIEGDNPMVDHKGYLKDFLLVMNQKDVLPELPDYLYDPIEVSLNGDQQKAFKQMVDEWVIALEHEGETPVGEGEEDIKATSRLAQATRMLQITSNLCNLTKGAGKPMPNSSAKEDLLIDMIRQGDIEFPLLVWSWFVPTTESIDSRIEKEFKGDVKTLYVSGQMTSEEKDAGIEAYKNGESDVLVLQMGVGKFGHTLVNTKTAFYHDRTFESDAYIQSLFRVKRIGLTHVPRLIIPRAPLSADPLVEMNLAGKMTSISKVASHDLQALLKSLGNIEWSMEEYDTGLDLAA